MKSHANEFELKDLLPLLGGPLIPVALFALIMHLGVELRLLPRPRPTLDTDRTVLIHQAEASRASHDAEILLLGDSSCLMDVSATQIANRLGRPVLNLGTLSYLDVGAYSILLREYVAANANRLSAVVLLMHPESLRRFGSEAYHLAVVTNFLNGVDHSRSDSFEGKLFRVLGVDIFKGRILARLMPSPLGGAYRRFYGFSEDLEGFLTDNQGSALDPDLADLVGSAEYRLSPVLEKVAREFRTAMPPGVKLFVGLTPVPKQFAGRNFPRQHLDLLRQWGEWLGADAVLDNLPATLPDDQFARTTHLKPPAVSNYTDAVSVGVGRLLRSQIEDEKLKEMVPAEGVEPTHPHGY